MSRKANVRVVSKDNGYEDNREKSFKSLLSAFRQAVNKAGILREYRLRETYESPSQKKRRKAREKEVTILKNQMRESFPVKKKEKPCPKNKK
jgi:ribosomal protein S21